MTRGLSGDSSSDFILVRECCRSLDFMNSFICFNLSFLKAPFHHLRQHHSEHQIVFHEAGKPSKEKQ